MNIATRKFLLLIAASLVAAFGLVACGGGDDDDDATRTPDVRAATPTAQSGDDNGEAEEIIVSMKDNFFEPKEITLEAGKTYKIVARNDGVAIHNMVILETDFASDMMVNKGESSEFEVKFDSPGTYDFQCDYHVPDMVGVITVK